MNSLLFLRMVGFLLLLTLPFSGSVGVLRLDAQDDGFGDRVIIGFYENARTHARYIASKYHVSLVMENEALNFAVFLPDEPPIFIDAVRREVAVEYVEIDQQGNLFSSASGVFSPNDPHYSFQWGPPSLRLDQAWAETIGTRNRIIAIVDSGVMYDHPDLIGNLWTASGFADVPDGSHGWNCVTGDNNAYDDYGHGTAVAGVASAVINNQEGIAGSAQALIMSVKVSDFSGKFYGSKVACAIQWAVDHGANIISMSFIMGDELTVRNAVAYAWNRGALLVAGAGNKGTEEVHCPACYDEVIAVSALQENDTLAGFSSFGSKIELSAPGVGIRTTCLYGEEFGSKLPTCRLAKYGSVSGTSFATPFISGIAALLWDFSLQRGGSPTNQMVRQALNSYVVDLGPAGRDNRYGFGKPDALALLLETPPAFPAGARLDAKNIQGSSVKLTWTAATDAIGIAKYNIYSGSGTNRIPFATVSGSTLAYGVYPLWKNTNYSFELEAVDDFGVRSTSSLFTTTTTWKLIGDVNKDCVVNTVDRDRVGAAYGTNEGDSRFDIEADLNNDSEIEIVDLALVGSNYERTC